MKEKHANPGEKMQKSLEDDPSGSFVYFNIRVVVRHSSMDPAEITSETGLEATRSWRAGDRKTTPTGRSIEGKFRDTMWSHVWEWRGTRKFASHLSEVVSILEAHADFFAKINDTGGSISAVIDLPGEVNVGDTFGAGLLGRMACLKVSLGVEVFPDF